MIARFVTIDIPGKLDLENDRLELLKQVYPQKRRWSNTISIGNRPRLRPRRANFQTVSPSLPAKGAPSPGKRKRDTISGSSSSLSEASPLASPSTAPPPPEQESARATPSSSTISDDARQPPPAASIAQYQTFGPNPLTFDDPTVYEILPVTDDMTDEEKKDIYCVSSFPHDDLHDLIAGTPPNKDFSNAVKPNNQVAFHTFHSYLENYLRPLKEEDIGFLNERVSKFTPSYGVCTDFLRVIEQPRSSCLGVASATTLKCGLKKMDHYHGTHQTRTGYPLTNLEVALIK